MYTLSFDSLDIDITVIPQFGKNIQIVAFKGKFNHQNAYSISRDLQSLFKEEVYELVLNLSELKYINSVGLAIILSMVKIVDQHSGKFVIGGVNKSIETIIQLVELPEKVLICSSVDEAIKHWSD
ncbi:MAG: STAS domain-containing protein [Leptospiraceae bacterium]|nr:STAS domain-containing protein [Leptospiraceae bacterium]MCP5499050.1 STAS domain-containing protein [Leptospiraceae bacterium]